MKKLWISMVVVLMTVSAAGDDDDSCNPVLFSELKSIAVKDEATRTGLRENLVVSASEQTEGELDGQLTSTSTGSSNNGANLLNFLPFMSISGLGSLLDGEAGEAQNDDLGIDLNIPVPGSKDGSRQLKIAASFDRSPEAFDPLIMSLDSTMQESVRASLESDLNLRDDAEYSLTYNINSKSLGRNKDVVSKIFGDVVLSADSSLYREAFKRYATLINQIDHAALRMAAGGGPVVIANMKMEDLVFKSPEPGQAAATAKDLCHVYKDFLELDAKLSRAENNALSEANFDAMAKLVSNQPQLHFKLAVKDRSPITGPNELSAGLTFEWGYRANINKLVSSCGGDCSVEEFTSYVNSNKKALDSSDRVSFSLEYADIDDYSFSATDPMVSFTQPGNTKLIGKFGYGRTLKDARLDFTFKYEDVEDNADLNDRAVGVFTLSKKFGDITVPFSLVYSNKSEYVAMESEKLSAHLGFKFEL